MRINDKKIFKKIFLKIVFILLFQFLFIFSFSCGIPQAIPDITLPDLQNPGYSYGYFWFTMENNEDDFEGYQLYYYEKDDTLQITSKAVIKKYNGSSFERVDDIPNILIADPSALYDKNIYFYYIDDVQSTTETYAYKIYDKNENPFNLEYVGETIVFILRPYVLDNNGNPYHITDSYSYNKIEITMSSD